MKVAGEGAGDVSNQYGAEDYGFWLAVAAAGRRFTYLPEVLFSYRKQPGQISSDPERMGLGQVYALTRTLLRLPPGSPVIPAILDRLRQIRAV